MGQNLYGRQVRVVISTPVDTPGNFKDVTTEELEINGGEGGSNRPPGLRVKFSIAKTDAKEPNTCELIVTNLSPSSRGSLQKKGVKVTIEAGYEETGTARIFRGDARTVDPVRNGADWDTTFKLGDGERAYRHARVKESFAPGAAASDILKYLGDASGLQIGNVPDVVFDQILSFDQGYTVSGLWKDEMDRFLKGLGYTWSVQDETLQILLPGRDKTDGTVPLISPDSGLIGSPEFGTPEKKSKQALVKFRSLLMPTRPRAKVHLKSQRYDGEVLVKKCHFTGDTHGGEWYTDYQGLLLNELKQTEKV